MDSVAAKSWGQALRTLVHIIRGDDMATRSVGTGVLTGSNVVVTAKHVVKQTESHGPLRVFAVEYPDAAVNGHGLCAWGQHATIRYEHPAQDIVVLNTAASMEITGRTFYNTAAAVPCLRSPAAGDETHNWGYPNAGMWGPTGLFSVQFSGPVYVRRVVLAATPTCIHCSLPSPAGNSGSPLFNGDGRLIAIASASRMASDCVDTAITTAVYAESEFVPLSLVGNEL